MRERSRVRHALVIEKLIGFRSHHPAVEPKQFAELLRVKHLDFLIRRLDLRQCFGSRRAVAGMRIEPVENQLAFFRLALRLAFRIRCVAHRAGGHITARNAIDDLALGPKSKHQRGKQLLGPVCVVVGKVADVNVKRDAVALRPCVDSQVRFSEQKCSRDAAGFAVPFGKPMPRLINDRQLRLVGRVTARLGKCCKIRQKRCATTAVEQIASQVKAIHLRPPAGPP